MTEDDNFEFLMPDLRVMDSPLPALMIARDGLQTADGLVKPNEAQMRELLDAAIAIIEHGTAASRG